MEQPVIIAVSSCCVSKYRDYQLSATSTTYYYLNPNIPEAEDHVLWHKVYCRSNNYRHKHKQGLVLHLMSSMQQSSDNSRRQLYLLGPRPIRRPLLQVQIQRVHHRPHCNGPLTIFTPAADKIMGHSCVELVEKYKPADPKKIPSEILATPGKSGVFQFPLNTLGNLTDLTLDDVFNIKKQDDNTSGNAQERDKGTPSSTSATTTQLMEKRDQSQKGKEKSSAKEGDKAYAKAIILINTIQSTVTLSPVEE
ncbi:hypothetical protein Tco_0109568 [Tanacetum coccineum]